MLDETVGEELYDPTADWRFNPGRRRGKSDVPFTKTSVKHLSSPITHSYAASSARVVLLMVSVRMFPFVSIKYLGNSTREVGRCFINKVKNK